MPKIDGREVISRADIVDRGLLPLTTARRVYRERATTGHPETAGTLPGGDGRALYWFEDDWNAWFTGFRKRRPVLDRSGVADGEVDADGAAALLGYSSGKTVTRKWSEGRFAAPDSYVDLPDGGRRSPRWKRSTLWEWADGPLEFDARGGARARKRTKSHPYAGDPRLEAVRGWLAAGDPLTGREVAARLTAELGPEHGASAAVAGLILATARKLAADE